jgi:hypothetical protein
MEHAILTRPRIQNKLLGTDLFRQLDHNDPIHTLIALIVVLPPQVFVQSTIPTVSWELFHVKVGSLQWVEFHRHFYMKLNFLRVGY